jgi:hypothetical protein
MVDCVIDLTVDDRDPVPIIIDLTGDSDSDSDDLQ